MANEDTKGIVPVEAIPAATLIILPSAIPQSKNRSGCSFANRQVLVACARSASRTTKGYLSASATSALPYASLVAILSAILFEPPFDLFGRKSEIGKPDAVQILFRCGTVPLNGVLHIRDALALD